MMAALLASPGINPAIELRKDELPSPLGRRVWVLSVDRVRHDNSAVAICQVTIMDLLHTFQMIHQKATSFGHGECHTLVGRGRVPKI
jgi:hypothetical protein